MKRIQCIIFITFMLSINVLLQGDLIQELKQVQESRGIRVTTSEELQFKKYTNNLAQQLASGPSLTNISQDNVEQVSVILTAFYMLFFDPMCIRYSTKEVMNDSFEQLKNWHDVLKKKNITIPWSAINGLELKSLLVQALKEICMFGRYTKHREENLVTFKLRLQHILTSIMMDSCLELWKDQLITHNELISLGSFYSWDVDFIKAEFKDSAALIPLFEKLSTTIDKDAEQQAAQRRAQELAIEKQQIAERKQKEAQTLQNMVLKAQQQSSAAGADKGALYLDYVRILLDPAYMDVSLTDRRAIDKINNQFKELHAIIGRTFMPIMSQEDIDVLKLLVAKSLEIISSPAVAGKTGGAAFKNHVEFVLKTLMTINPNQTLTENQIKFQWIKPLYVDNQFLIDDLKKKCLDKFNSSDFQRWQAAIRNFKFKVAPANEPIIPVSISVSAPVIPEQMPVIEKAPEKIQEVEEIVETLPMSKSLQQSRDKRDAERVAAAERDAAAKRAAEEGKKAATVQRTTLTQEAPRPVSADLSQVSEQLIAQSLVGSAATIKNILDTVEPSQKFDLIGMQDNAQYTAVHQAASLGRADVLKLLLNGLTPDQIFAIVNMRDRDGQTALYLASAAKSAPGKGFRPLDAVKELFKGLTYTQQIALINTPDNDGITPLDVARSSKNTFISTMFRDILQKGRK